MVGIALAAAFLAYLRTDSLLAAWATTIAVAWLTAADAWRFTRGLCVRLEHRRRNREQVRRLTEWLVRGKVQGGD